jgi:hypothetical protein
MRGGKGQSITSNSLNNAASHTLKLPAQPVLNDVA